MPLSHSRFALDVRYLRNGSRPRTGGSQHAEVITTDASFGIFLVQAVASTACRRGLLQLAAVKDTAGSLGQSKV